MSFVLFAAALAAPVTTSSATEVAKAPAAACESKAATVDKAFPTGAFADCQVKGKKRFALTIAPEDEGQINCSAWYAFRLTPARRGRVTVELNYPKCGHRYWPKMSTDGISWEYIPPKAVTVEGEGDDRTATIKLKLNNQPVFIAAQEIIPPSTYDAWLSRVTQSSAATRRLLGKSAEGRDIEAMAIADPAGGQKEVILLVGRQHPPEITGALAMFPFVETLLGDSDLAKRYRSRFHTEVVPLVNPDGVVRGHWRHNTGGVDLNRDWGPFTQPETKLMQGLLEEIANNPDQQLRLMLDFHSTNRDVFYTIPDELPTDPPLFTRDWLARYQQLMPDYKVNRDARHTVGRPISKAHIFDTYGAPAITFEIGDETDRILVRRIGEQSAIAMMETLLATPKP
ncbi:M14-type cytosolic carboxypeptidase [Pontixanthobacter aestiaquae]|uniref:Peptidase M14 domain-containing protein n=1 Tax=Pontixanthobacter aestiaquae TaxID=1509367 RepID=A0A844Z1Y2_9SPHN|nr:M14-type cytosolic carboxypeptidase [Pontixanthobacter aestiaquae]MDN3646288.1 M14-type cytosolic carboxypeptidase [Pontixanthobacter aestiaquae]MXO82721.1 hypothetical protein [Pontixanthobacter aestiaquae]